LGPGASGVKLPAAAAVDGAVLGAVHPAAINSPSATANAMVVNNFVLKQLMRLAQLRPNIAWFVQKETFLRNPFCPIRA
jgi:hypothetical protein